MSVGRPSWSNATMSEAVEDYESRDNHQRKVLDDSTVKLLWQMLRAIEHEVVHAAELCSICSATVFQDHLLLSLQSPSGSCFRQNFAEICHRSRYCWFCRFLCRVVAQATLQKHFMRCLKNIPLKVSYGRWESKLLLSVNTTAPTISYEIDIDSRRAKSETGAFEDL